MISNSIAMSPGRVGICVRLGFYLNAHVVYHSRSNGFVLSLFPSFEFQAGALECSCSSKFDLI